MIRVAVNPTNPGQFFACCGLLELADRLWPPTEGWFEEREFCLRPEAATDNTTVVSLLNQLASCTLTNTMTVEQVARLDRLSEMKASLRANMVGLDDEKKSLEKLRREEPILLQAPFNLRIDWFEDDRAGGSRFKTWAGQQSVLDIASSMKKALGDPECRMQGCNRPLPRIGGE